MPSWTGSAIAAFLRRCDPELAHWLALQGLAAGVGGHDAQRDGPPLAVEALGLRFCSPIGLAAGFDKNAVALRGLARLGFGFVEAGTVTPRRQAGNPRPRLFRLDEDHAVINRMGFNNVGLAGYLTSLAAFPRESVPIGVNIGINRSGADPERDYCALVRAVAPYADYIAINISSPNTPGLRDLQAASRLRSILRATAGKVAKGPPLLVKLAPDLPEQDLGAIIEVCVCEGVDGLIVSNTTTARPLGLRSRHASEAGGLSGAPLSAPSTQLLRSAARIAAGRLTLIGVGGIGTGADVLEKLVAGASLVQIYTSLVYAGPAIISRLKRELAVAMNAQGFFTVADAIGAAVKW